MLTASDTKSVTDVAHKHGLPVHLDGARIFNAAVALGVPAAELTAEVDSVSFCFSKGLSAPVGSALCGSFDFIARARKWRKMLGGGMRQVGVLAAAGIVGLQQMVPRLAEDHENAMELGRRLSEIPGIELDPSMVETNLVFFDVSGTGRSARDLSMKLKQKGIWIGAVSERKMRAVTHLDVNQNEIHEALEILSETLQDSEWGTCTDELTS